MTGKVMTAGEYIRGFASTILYGLTRKHDDVAFSDVLDELQVEIDSLEFVVKYGNRDFEYGQDPDEHAEFILGESAVRIDIPIDIAKKIAEMMVLLLIDEWSRADLYGEED